MVEVSYQNLTPKYFKQVIALANQVHGEGYLNDENMADWAAYGISSAKINCSYVALLHNSANIKANASEVEHQLIGFRITFASEHWQVDQWCSPDLWQVTKNKCCYFKCNTVNELYRGLGIGKKLLQLSIQAAKTQGAQAGIAHLWQQSPNNSAVAYFTHCGGELIKTHPNKWNEESKQGYHCILCGHNCCCEAAEMIIHFN